MDFGIRGKVALVTGSGQGLGRATALALAKEGVNVCVSDVNEENGLKVMEEAKALGVKAIFVKTDVSDPEQITSLFDTILEQLGPEEILVNNAGISPKTATFDKLTPEEFTRVLSVNVLGAYLCAQQAFVHMKVRGWGRIVNLSSIGGIYGSNVSGVHYTSSKGALISMTKSLSRNMGPFNITVNAVAPGRIATPMALAAPPEVNEAIRQRIALRRLGTPEDVANVIVFLASEPGGYVTGDCVNIDGGYIS